MLDKLTSESFSKYLNTPFSISFTEDLPEEAELVEITAHKAGSNQPERKSFSLIFRTTSSHNHEQGTYNIKHSEMPEMFIFLVPIGPEGDGFCYEAVFN